MHCTRVDILLPSCRYKAFFVHGSPCRRRSCTESGDGRSQVNRDPKLKREKDLSWE
jgi:hypothetical protein